MSSTSIEIYVLIKLRVLTKRQCLLVISSGRGFVPLRLLFIMREKKAR